MRRVRPETACGEAITDQDVKARYAAIYDALLASWPVPYEQRDVATTLGRTHVVISGPRNAPSLVLLHAFQATATVWRPNIDALSRRFRVYAVDIIGQGGKSESNQPIKRRRDFANWMCELFDTFDIAQASLVGNSYGAFLALNQASLTPARVDRVVMINPAGVFASFVPQVSRMLINRLLVALHLKAKPPQVAIGSFLGRNVVLRPDEQEWAGLVSLVAFTNVARPNAILPTVFSRAELRAIRAPVLLLMGDNDLLYDPHATVRRALDRMPSIEAAIVPNAHHMAAMAKPDEVSAQIIEFLQRAPTSIAK